MKRCSGCHETKPFDAFYHDYGRLDTYYPYCKTCASQRNKADYARKRAHMLKVNREWRANNRERLNEYARLWRRRKAMKENGL